MKTHIDLNGKSILVTGCPGLIGANLVMRLLKELDSGTIVSLDNMNDYYEPSLKEYRLNLIEEAAKKSPVKHVFVQGNLSDKPLIRLSPSPVVYGTPWAGKEGLNRNVGVLLPEAALTAYNVLNCI